MNPYAAPTAAPADDRSNPRFQVIAPTSLAVRTAFAILCVVLLIAGVVSLFHATYTLRFAPFLFGGGFGGLPSTIGMWWISLRLRAKLRRHPLVLDGRALYGGSAIMGSYRRAIRGYLFITSDSVMFFARSRNGGNASEPVAVPFPEIASVEKKWGRLALRQHSGVTIVFVLGQAKLWRKAIATAQAAHTAAPPR